MGGFNRISVVKASSNHDTVPSDSARKDGGRSAGREARDAGGGEGGVPPGKYTFYRRRKTTDSRLEFGFGRGGQADDQANFISKIAFHDHDRQWQASNRNELWLA